MVNERSAILGDQFQNNSSARVNLLGRMVLRLRCVSGCNLLCCYSTLATCRARERDTEEGKQQPDHLGVTTEFLLVHLYSRVGFRPTPDRSCGMLSVGSPSSPQAVPFDFARETCCVFPYRSTSSTPCLSLFPYRLTALPPYRLRAGFRFST